MTPEEIAKQKEMEQAQKAVPAASPVSEGSDKPSAMYFVRQMKRYIADQNIEVWEISPLNAPGKSQKAESYEIFVERGSRVEKQLIASQSKIVEMMFDGEPTTANPVKLLTIEEVPKKLNGYKVDALKNDGYMKYADIPLKPDEISIEPIQEHLESDIDAVGYMRVFEDQLNLLGKYSKSMAEKDVLQETAHSYALNGIAKERNSIRESQAYYKAELRKVFAPELGEGWKREFVPLARYAAVDGFTSKALPEINKKVTKEMVAGDPADAQQKIKDILQKTIGSEGYNLDEISGQLVKLTKADRADLMMLMQDEAGVAQAAHANKIDQELGSVISREGTEAAYILGANLKLANQVGRDGIPMLEGVKKQVSNIPKDAQGNYLLEPRTKKDMDILFGEGEWTNEHVSWIKQTNDVLLNRMVEVDSQQRLTMLDKIEQLSYAGNAVKYYDYAENAIKAKTVTFPYDIEDYVGRKGKVFNVNINQFIAHPDDNNRLTTKPVEEYGYEVAQDMVDYYAQQALNDRLTVQTATTFSRVQVDLADKGIIPAPSPKDYEEFETKTRMGVTARSYKPKEEMRSRSWEIAQNTGPQVLSHIANMTFGKTAPDQYMHDEVTNQTVAMAQRGNLAHNLTHFEDKMRKEGREIDPDGTADNPGTALTHLKLSSKAQFGEKDTRLIKEGIDPKLKAGAVFVGILGAGLVINSIEGLDNNFS